MMNLMQAAFSLESLFIFLPIIVSTASSSPTHGNHRFPLSRKPSQPSNYFDGVKADANNNNDNYHYRFDSTHGRPFDSRLSMTCVNYPRMCGARWSPGPDCCRTRCVNLETDFFNCGRCGQMCRFGQTCCEGRCVDVMFNKDHCGWCTNRCREGATCTYGMCDYS